jgi:cellulose biosynthesis protein BcsQ
MKILVYTDKGGAGKSTLATDVLPYFFWKDGKRVVLVDADPNNFTSVSADIPNGEWLRLNIKSDDIIEERKKLYKLADYDNWIIDTAGGYLANDTVDFLAKQGFLEDIDLVIIPIKVGGSAEPNAVQSYNYIKHLLSEAKIVFALVGSVNLNWTKIKNDFLSWFGLDHIVKEEKEALEKAIGEKIIIDEYAFEREIDEEDRNYFVVPYNSFLPIRWAIGNQPAFMYLEKEYSRKEEIILSKNLWSLIKSAQDGEVDEEGKKMLKANFVKIARDLIEAIFVNIYKGELRKFYSVIEKQEPILFGNEKMVANLV